MAQNSLTKQKNVARDVIHQNLAYQPWLLLGVDLVMSKELIKM